MSSQEPKKISESEKIKVLVKPNSAKSSVIGYDPAKEAWRISIKAVPEDGKANAELLKFLYKEFKIRFEIVTGFTSKEKILRKIS